MFSFHVYQVVEWKYRGNEIFSFRNKWQTLDMWDFSGDPELSFIYSCFSCSQSLHLVVCDAREGVHSLATWLSDIQVSRGVASWWVWSS